MIPPLKKHFLLNMSDQKSNEIHIYQKPENFCNKDTKYIYKGKN